MKCPACGKEMNPGLLYCGGRPVFWAGKEWDWEREDWDMGTDTVIQLNRLAWSDRDAAKKSPTAYHCPDCRKIIVDY